MTITTRMESSPSKYDTYRLRVESALAELVPAETVEPQAIHAAMKYCLTSGGKRLRPVLLLAAADLYPTCADPLPAAVAVECLHTYSLVHDDLPCMDDSPLRRGRPSAHVHFDEATAVLAGDALLTEAFLLLTRHYRAHPECSLALLECLGEAADSRHLIAGQVVDTLSENRRISALELDFIHQHKTADLITASLRMGLLLTSAPPEAHQTIARVGRSLGLAFQIVDDILDASSSSEKLGKTVGNDARQAKNTYVSLHGMEASRKRVHEETDEAIRACQQLPGEGAAFLLELIEKLEFRLN